MTTNILRCHYLELSILLRQVDPDVVRTYLELADTAAALRAVTSRVLAPSFMCCAIGSFLLPKTFYALIIQYRIREDVDSRWW